MVRTVAFGAGALIAAGLLTWNPAPTSGWNQGSAEATLWQLLNGARTNNGMAPLQQHATLAGIARWRSSDMLERDYFNHIIPGCNCLVYASYDSNGLAYDWAGENIGWNSGRSDAESPVHVHEKFMASAGHRANVLTPAFTHGAVGAAAADNQMFQGYVQNTRMYTELFLQAPGAAAPPPAAPQPPVGGGSAQAPAAPAAPAAPVPSSVPTPEPRPKAKAVAVEAPQRPTSETGLDGITTRVADRTGPFAAHRFAADDALIITRSATVEPPATAVGAGDRGIEVTAARPADSGLFEGVVGALIGFLFG